MAAPPPPPPPAAATGRGGELCRLRLQRLPVGGDVFAPG
eukprot:gene4843-6567_t